MMKVIQMIIKMIHLQIKQLHKFQLNFKKVESLLLININQSLKYLSI
jgi:hypothetical protein